MNDIFKILDIDFLCNIFIGITGILIAVVIFIAELMKDQDNDLYKRVILEKTDIKFNISFIIYVFSYIFICNFFDYNNEKFVFLNIIYIVTRIILIALIIRCALNTIKTFYISLKFNSENDYFNEELDKYIKNRIIKINEDTNRKSIPNVKKYIKEFNDFIDNQCIYSNDLSFLEKNDEYEPIYPTTNGIIKKYDYKMLNALANSYIEEKINLPNYNFDDEHLVLIVNLIGKKTNKKTPLFYCKKSDLKIFKELSEYVIYYDNRVYINEELNLINKSLVNFAASYTYPYAFDDNNRLYNYYDFLYKNNLVEIKSLALEQLREYYISIYKNYYKNSQFTKFLNKLSYLSYKNHCYEDYSFINNIELFLYYQQLSIEKVDIKGISYYFANNVFRYNFYSIKENEDIRYYDNLLAMLFKFMMYLMKNDLYDGIDVLLSNISLETVNYKDNDLDKYDILKFQFCCGIIYGLIMLSNNDKLDNIENEKIKKIINYFSRCFINLYDVWETIICFKKYYSMSSCIHDAYEHFDFDFIEHKYKNSWVGFGINEREILKEFIILFNINFAEKESINLNDITREDKYFYQDLLKIFEESSHTKLECYMNINYNKTATIEMLNYVLKISNEKEKEYNRKHKLKQEKIEKFREEFNKKLHEENPLINLLRTCKKIENNEKKLTKVYGINQLIPREIFFEDVGGFESIAISYADTMLDGITKEYIRKIDRFVNVSSNTFEKILNSLEDIDDYIILTNYLSRTILKKYSYDYNNSTIKFNGKLIDVINISNVNCIYVLNKLSLPKLQLCKFSDEWNKKFIYNSLFFELIDCSNNEHIRKELINHSKWIEEKGTIEERDNYLKENCNLKIYLSFRILKIENEIGYKIEISNND